MYLLSILLEFFLYAVRRCINLSLFQYTREFETPSGLNSGWYQVMLDCQKLSWITFIYHLQYELRILVLGLLRMHFPLLHASETRVEKLVHILESLAATASQLSPDRLNAWAVRSFFWDLSRSTSWLAVERAERGFVTLGHLRLLVSMNCVQWSFTPSPTDSPGKPAWPFALPRTGPRRVPIAIFVAM
ncbi:hypothetical protein DFH11DRAFT_922424 [Phellopilus nigrolimitatus]|nr:hypothetical protein DFH11DRAFT_922424 [Phellopilus nigrolimitatus]